MIIASKAKELFNKANTIISNPIDYGISIYLNKRIKIRDVFESIVIIQDWHWINIYDIIDILNANNFEIIDGEFILALSDSIQKLNFRKEYDFEPFEQLFLPISEIERPILYTNIKSALLVAGHRNGDFEKSIVKKISKDALARNGIELAVVKNAFLVKGNLESIGKIIAKEEIESQLAKLYQDIMFSEILFIDDEGHRDSACLYLSKKLNQIELEEKLVFNLKDTSPDVRANVCLALLFLISSEMFDVNKVLPEQYSKTLSDHTVIELLNLLKDENDAYVISSAIGALKIQNYSEKSSNLVYQVKNVFQKIYGKLTDTQIRSDCENLIKYLEDIINHPKSIKTIADLEKLFKDLARKQNFEETCLRVSNFISSKERLLELKVAI